MAKKIFIFDFDGVIVDSFEEVLRTLNSLSDRYRFKKVDLSNLQALREMDSKQLYVEAFGIAPWKIIFGVRAARKVLKKKMLSCPLVFGIDQALKEMRQHCQSMGIITSNSVENARLFLQKYELDIFDFVISGNVFHKHKGLQRCIKTYGFLPKDIYYVGDETRDIEAARKVKVNSVAVSWGFSSRKLLEKFQPDLLLDEPKQLIKLC